jgi:hypothetical protein
MTNLCVEVHEEPTVIFDTTMMELKDRSSVGEQPLVLGASMITAEAKQLLIPTAGLFDIAHGDHDLR